MAPRRRLSSVRVGNIFFSFCRFVIQNSRSAASAAAQKPREFKLLSVSPNLAKFEVKLPAKDLLVDVPPLWLRWNCECSKCKQKGSGQKTMDPLSWPDSIEYEDIWLENDLIKFKLKNDDHIGKSQTINLSKSVSI